MGIGTAAPPPRDSNVNSAEQALKGALFVRIPRSSDSESKIVMQVTTGEPAVAGKYTGSMASGE
jgi:hypothetical protein